MNFDNYVSYRMSLFKHYKIAVNSSVVRELRGLNAVMELTKTLRPEDVQIIKNALADAKAPLDLFEIIVAKSSLKSTVLSLSSLSVAVHLFDIMVGTLTKTKVTITDNVSEKLIRWFHDKVKKIKSLLRTSYVDSDYETLYASLKNVSDNATFDQMIDTTKNDYRAMLPSYWYDHVRPTTVTIAGLL